MLCDFMCYWGLFICLFSHYNAFNFFLFILSHFIFISIIMCLHLYVYSSNTSIYLIYVYTTIYVFMFIQDIPGAAGIKTESLKVNIDRSGIFNYKYLPMCYMGALLFVFNSHSLCTILTAINC